VRYRFAPAVEFILETGKQYYENIYIQHSNEVCVGAEEVGSNRESNKIKFQMHHLPSNSRSDLTTKLLVWSLQPMTIQSGVFKFC